MIKIWCFWSPKLINLVLKTNFNEKTNSLIIHLLLDYHIKPEKRNGREFFQP